MKRKSLTEEDLINLWLEPIFGKTLEQALKENPELVNNGKFYKEYAVSQEEHDKWYEEAVTLFSKHFRLAKKNSKRLFAFTYLNTSPSIKEEELKK